MNDSLAKKRYLKGTDKQDNPESGKSHGVRMGDECFRWAQSVGGAGFVLRSIFEDPTLRFLVENYYRVKVSGGNTSQC